MGDATYAVNIDDIRRTDDSAQGSLHLVKQFIDKLTRQLLVAADRMLLSD
jgi:hypothetical protein